MSSTTVSFVFLGLQRILKETELILNGQMIENSTSLEREQPQSNAIFLWVCKSPLMPRLHVSAPDISKAASYCFSGAVTQPSKTQQPKQQTNQSWELHYRGASNLHLPAGGEGGLGLWMMSVIPWHFLFITLMRWNLSWGQSCLLSQTFTRSIMAHGGHICN